MANQQAIAHSVNNTNLADLIERILDKGIVITGDIKVILADVELLTIQIRLVICSIEKAMEMGMDWWKTNPAFTPGGPEQADALAGMEKRLNQLESSFSEG